jgi:hypothetical protein
MVIRMAELQAIAESRMRDHCIVTVAGDAEQVWDEENLTFVPPEGEPFWSGPCRLRTGGNVAGGADRAVGGDQVAISKPTLSVPVSAPRLPIDAVVVIDAVPADDPAGALRLNLRMRVTGPIVQTDATAQRLQVEIDNG